MKKNEIKALARKCCKFAAIPVCDAFFNNELMGSWHFKGYRAIVPTYVEIPELTDMERRVFDAERKAYVTKLRRQNLSRILECVTEDCNESIRKIDRRLKREDLSREELRILAYEKVNLISFVCEIGEIKPLTFKLPSSFIFRFTELRTNRAIGSDKKCRVEKRSVEKAWREVEISDVMDRGISYAVHHSEEPLSGDLP